MTSTNTTLEVYRIFCFSKNFILLYISFSVILLRIDKKDIYWWFEVVIGRYLLNTGMTLACCIFSGTIPGGNKLSMIRNGWEEISEQQTFNNFKGILLGHVDFPVLNR